jgi:hypothetical protein
MIVRSELGEAEMLIQLCMGLIAVTVEGGALEVGSCEDGIRLEGPATKLNTECNV